MNGKLIISFFAIAMLLAITVIAAGGGGSPIIRTLPEPEPEPDPILLEISQEEYDTLKCSTLKTIGERVSCRINLEQENELNYLPEECRALEKSGNDRVKCKNFYNSVQTCWIGSNQANPVACARTQLALGQSISSEISSCDGNSDCINDVTEKIHSLNKFRLYNLEWKAEYLIEEGVNINHELLVDLISNLELKKQKYNAAQTIQEKKQIIRNAQSLWQSFANKIRKQEGI